MTGKDFIVLAKKLAEEVGPAECRSARTNVRAYATKVLRIAPADESK